MPRASEITVVYEEAEEFQGGGVKWVKRTANLQDLIDTQANGHQLTASARMRHGDPRELVIKASNQLTRLVELPGAAGGAI